MDQKTVVYLHNGIVHSRKKKEAPTLCNSMDGTAEHYAKWNKPGSERQIPYDLPYKCNLVNKTNKQKEQKRTRDMGIKNKLTGTRRKGWGIIQERSGTCTKDSWTRTMRKGLSLGVGFGSGKG